MIYSTTISNLLHNHVISERHQITTIM